MNENLNDIPIEPVENKLNWDETRNTGSDLSSVDSEVNDQRVMT